MINPADGNLYTELSRGRTNVSVTAEKDWLCFALMNGSDGDLQHGTELELKDVEEKTKLDKFCMQINKEMQF